MTAMSYIYDNIIRYIYPNVLIWVLNLISFHSIITTTIIINFKHFRNWSSRYQQFKEQMKRHLKLLAFNWTFQTTTLLKRDKLNNQVERVSGSLYCNRFFSFKLLPQILFPKIIAINHERRVSFKRKKRGFTQLFSNITIMFVLFYVIFRLKDQ